MKIVITSKRVKRASFAALVAALVGVSVARYGSEIAVFAQIGPPPGAAGSLVIPTDAYLKGAWSAVGSWPLIPVHMVLMPDGRVMSYGTDGTGRQTGNFIYDVWDGTGAIAAGHMTLPKRDRYRHLLQFPTDTPAGRIGIRGRR